MAINGRVVIIGGGIVGCSIAYHLTKLGWKDIHVLEKGELTSGSTWHAAGLVGQLRSSRNVTRMLQKSVQLYQTLEEETGQATGWKQVGGLRLASSKDRWIELKRAATMAKSFGLEMQLMDAKEAQRIFPMMSTEGVVGAALLPTDGFADPSMITQALAKGARSRGAKFHRGVRVLETQVKDGYCKDIITDQGVFTAEIVVNAAGLWAREVGKMAGVNVPLIPVQHQYVVTDDIPGMTSGYPTMRDPDNLVYYKEEMKGVVMGGYEHNPIPWSVDGVPKDFGQELLESNMEHFSDLYEKAIRRTPILEKVGIRKLINGPEAFTPDGTFLMGRVPELRNYYLAAGFNAHGIAAGGGAGLMMAEWIIHGEPSLDLWSVDIRRFHGKHYHETPRVRDRTLEGYARHYSIHWPHEEHETVRNVLESPLYSRLKEKGACFGSKAGWERPNWFAPKGMEAKDATTFGKPNWFEAVAAEHRAIREGVALIDQSSFSKIWVQGAGALSFLDGIADNDLQKPPGALTYTQFCSDRGGIVSDLTIGRISEDSFYIVTGTTFGTHDQAWLEEHRPAGSAVTIRDVTREGGVINLCGPKSRELLSRVVKKGTEAGLSHEAFPFATWKEIEIAGNKLRALRVTYVGELGWELHIPIHQMTAVYDKLWEAGQDLGVVNAGYRTIESLRLEKGYRYWSTDLTPDYTPYEAGLGFCVRLSKPEFIGKKALTLAKDKGPRFQLITLTLDKYVPLHGGESICREGRVVGVLSSGGYGHTVQKTIAMGYVASSDVPQSLSEAEAWELDVMGERYPARRHTAPLYDPKRSRILV